MARALELVSDRLTWEYGYARVPKALEKKYAYCEIAGPQGPVRSERLILGFVLFAPNTTYPQHSHSKIEESYISHSGAFSDDVVVGFVLANLIFVGLFCDWSIFSFEALLGVLVFFFKSFNNNCRDSIKQAHI